METALGDRCLRPCLGVTGRGVSDSYQNCGGFCARPDWVPDGHEELHVGS